jgi:cell fate (sporulation/competence/biofilm development) regulator YmcA (YheA/YmcA/DUF963 family)
LQLEKSEASKSLEVQISQLQKELDDQKPILDVFQEDEMKDLSGNEDNVDDLYEQLE